MLQWAVPNHKSQTRLIANYVPLQLAAWHGISTPAEIRYSKTRSRPYFYNNATSESRWEAPAGLTDDQVRALPGAHYLTGSAPTEASNEPGKVRASHLLVKHNQSRRPSSWKDANITRSKQEAIEILKGHEQRLQQSGDLQSEFAKLASTESDCSSARSGGDLGWFTRGQMQKPFEEASFATSVGQMSSIVETDSGVHLILRTG
ncbi:peptidyl-prolyl cis-trans isomerase Pin1 [Microbotryomycetes sp. JL201]|nr:peptidyl-prolyl cis-trans isomerase Pin1 [Microbotryomycetes sp. JL201]